MYRNRLMRSTRAAITATFALGLTVSAHAQAGKPTPEMKYQAIQRSIRTLVANLEEYLRENPNSKDAPIARIQLNSLKNLQSSGAAVLPVALQVDNNLGTTLVEWAITSITKKSDKTIVTFTIHNLLDASKQGFRAFERNPLSLTDNKGQFYDMLAVTSEPPAGVEVSNDHATWTLQAGQTILVTVEFDPLAPGTTSGKIVYKDNRRTTPAEFSLLNKRQMAQ